MDWIEHENEHPEHQTDNIYTEVFGVQVAQVVGSNPYDGLTVFGIVFDPEEDATYLTRECAERLIGCLMEAITKADELFG